MGTYITSSYPNSADRSSFPTEKINFKSKTIQPTYNVQEKKLHQLYAEVRDMRFGKIEVGKLSDILDTLISYFEQDWLLSLEICEIVDKSSDIFKRAHTHLQNLQIKYPENKKLILDGLKLIR